MTLDDKLTEEHHQQLTDSELLEHSREAFLVFSSIVSQRPKPNQYQQHVNAANEISKTHSLYVLDRELRILNDIKNIRKRYK